MASKYMNEIFILLLVCDKQCVSVCLCNKFSKRTTQNEKKIAAQSGAKFVAVCRFHGNSVKR